jgi:hypothetical protein
MLLAMAGGPGLPPVYLVPLSILFTALALAWIWQSPDRFVALGRALVSAAALAAGILWWLIPTLPMIRFAAGQSRIEAPSIDQLRYVSGFSGVPNVVSLTAEPVLYVGAGRFVPFASWAWIVTTGIGQVLRFALPLIAALGGVYAYRTKRTRPVAVGLGACAAVGVFLSKGLNAPFPNVNLQLLNRLPFGDAFRHPVDKFSLLLVPSLCLLFAFGIASLFKQRRFLVVTVCIALVSGWLTLPWWTGLVVPRGGGPVPSGHVSIPHAYDLIGAKLDGAPVGGKTMVLPYSVNGASAFRWSSGVQPNLDPLLEDWAPNRSLLARVTGYEYADVVGDTLAFGVEHRDPRTFSLAHLWGVDRWLVHTDWADDYIPMPITPEAGNSFLINSSTNRPAPIDRLGQRIPIPTSLRALELDVFPTEPPVSQDQLLEVGPVILQFNREGYFGLLEPSRGIWEPGDYSIVSYNTWHTVDLWFSPSGVTLALDGVRHGMEVPLSRLPRYATVLPSCDQCGVVNISNPHPGMFRLSRPVTTSGAGYAPWLMIRTEDLFLFKQPALPVVYAAHVDATAPDPATKQGLLEAAAAVRNEHEPVLVPERFLQNIGRLDPGAWTSWNRDTPTTFSGSLNLSGTTVLVLSQSFDPGWRLIVNGSPISDSDHFVANGFANGWIVRGSGSIRWRATYDPQRAYHQGLLVAALLAILCALLLLFPPLASLSTRRPSK